MPAFTTAIQHSGGILARTIRQKKEKRKKKKRKEKKERNKRYPNWKGRSKTISVHR